MGLNFNFLRFGPLRLSAALRTGLMLLLVSLRLDGATLIVTSTADAGAGTLRDAIAAANSGDSIHFDFDQMNGRAIGVTNELLIAKDLTIDGVGLTRGLLISGSETTRIMRIAAGHAVTLNQLDLFRGKVNGNGGAILNEGSMLTVSNSAFISNKALNGGAIYSNTDLTGNITRLVNCSIYQNEATNSGGGFFNNIGRTELLHCTIFYNASLADDGGGVASWGASDTETVVGNTIIAGNDGDDVDFVNNTLNSFISDGYNLIGQGGNALANFNATGDTTGVNDPGVLPNSIYRPTFTLALYPSSPAINAGGPSALMTDQRGAPRPFDGAPDIGAYEHINSVLPVSSILDFGPGSLRDAVEFSPTNSTITFSPSLNGATIILTRGSMVPAGVLTIDASALPDGVAVSGGGKHWFMSFSSGGLTVNNMTIRDGVRAFNSNINGHLTLNNVTISGQTDGAVFVDSGGTVIINNSTISGNSARYGGGIWCRNSDVTINHSTISGNSISSISGDAGGIYLADAAASLYLRNSIVAGNTSSGLFAPDIYRSPGSSVTNGGANVIGNNQTVESEFPTGPLAGSPGNLLDPGLAPLANNGGWAPTMALLPGSPALDAAIPDGSIVDQRGAPRSFGTGPDIGAHEQINTVLPVTTTANSGPNSLRNAVSFSPAGSTVLFDPALNGATIALTEGPLTVRKNLNIDSSGLDDGITISGNDAWRVFAISAGISVQLRHLNITAGMVTDDGAGIHSQGTLLLSDSAVFGNTADGDGGGIFNSGSLTVRNSTVSENTAEQGAGIKSQGGSLTLDSATVSSNSATIAAGGLENDGSFFVLGNSIVAANSAPTQPDILKTTGFLLPTGVNLLGDLSGSGLSAGPGVKVGPPLLAPLGDYGGPTRSMPPLTNSPAIDAGGTTANTQDQRGAWRDAQPDIGAAEFVSVVKTASDTGAGSLRNAVAFYPPNNEITFDPQTMDGETIVFTSGQILFSNDLSIDASSLPSGITLSGNNATRVLLIDLGTDVQLTGLTVVAGNSGTSDGGGILNAGTLALSNMTIWTNIGRLGGGLFNTGTLTMNQSSLYGNSATSRGGAFYNQESATLNNVTIHANHADINGGGIRQFAGSLILNNVTVSENTATSAGGGIAVGGGTATLMNAIVSGNSAPAGPDIDRTSGTVAAQGVNLLTDLSSSSLVAGPNVLVGEPLLEPLANNGGRTLTMALPPGSPARDAGRFILGMTPETDQRGAAGHRGLGGALDIGAYEASTLTPSGVTLAAQFGTNGIAGAKLRVSTDTNFDERFEVTTVAGTNTFGLVNGSAPVSKLYLPYGISVSTDGGVYIADAGNSAIRRLQKNGQLSTPAGSGEFGFVNGPGASAKFAFPLGVAVDAVGNIFVADSENHVIRKVNPAGTVSVFAGSGEGFVDGPALSAKFACPTGVVLDRFGNLYVADTLNQRIRRITPSGNVTTVAGSSQMGFVDATGTAARFNMPSGVAMDPVEGILYVADRDNHAIRKVTPAGVVTTLAGTGLADFGNSENPLFATFSSPAGVAVDSELNVYVADRDNHRIRLISGADSNVTTFAGTGASGFADGLAASAQFDHPLGVAVDAQLNVFVTDSNNNRIRKITRKPLIIIGAVAGDDFIGQANALSPGVQYFYQWSEDGTTNLGPVLSFTTFAPMIRVFDGPNMQAPEIANGQLSPIAFGTTRPSTPLTRSVTIANVGDFALALNSVSLPVAFSVTGFTSGPLASGATLTVQVQFQSSATGMYTGEMVIYSDDFDDPAFRFKVSGTVSLAGTIEGWRQQHFGQSANSGIGANAQNADSGTLENWKEYVFGLDPHSDADDVLPAWQRDGDFFTITYRRPVGASDVIYQVVGAQDVRLNWLPISVTEQVTPVEGGSVEEVVVRLPYANGANNAFFYQLLVTVSFSVP